MSLREGEGDRDRWGRDECLCWMVDGGGDWGGGGGGGK